MLNSAKLDSRTAQTHRTTSDSAFGSKERKQHTTQQPHQHDMRFQLADKLHPRSARHTRPQTKPSTHQPTNTPCYSSTAANGCVGSYSNFATAGRLYSGENNILLLYQRKITAPPPTGTNTLTHARNDRHPPTQPTARQLTNPSYHLALQPKGATAVQQHSSTYQLVRTPTQTEAFGPYSIFFLKTRSWARCTSSGVQYRVLTHPPTHNPPMKRYGYLPLHAEDTRSCDCDAHNQNKAPSARFYYGVVVPFG